MSDVMRLRTCVVGMGVISAAMWPALAYHPRLDVRVVVDPDPRARERIPVGSGEISVLATLEEAMSATQFELAVINSPAEYHVDQARTALGRGVDVLVAKPLSPTLAEARDLAKLARQQGRHLAVAEQIRYNVHYQHVSALVADGLVGDVSSVIFTNAKPRPLPGTLRHAAHPALDENACHHFDALRCILAERSATTISCREFNPPWSPYDRASMVNALITYQNRIEVLYQGGFAARASMYELRLEGSRGVLRCRGEHMSQGPMQYELSTDGGPFLPLPGHPPIEPDDAWASFLDAWWRWYEQGGDSPFSAEGALPILALVDAAKRSAELGAAVAPRDPSGG
jgi:predicted dehydrogenase